MIRTSHLFRYLLYTLKYKKNYDVKVWGFSKWPLSVNILFYHNYSCGCRMKLILAATSRFFKAKIVFKHNFNSTIAILWLKTILIFIMAVIRQLNDNSVPLNIASMLCTTHIVTGVFLRHICHGCWPRMQNRDNS